MALLGPDGFWHIPRDPGSGPTTSVCGLAFIGEFEGRDDNHLPTDGQCPDCTGLADPRERAADELIVPALLVEAAVMAVEAYEHGGAGELDGALARLATEVERARDASDPLPA